MSETMTLEKPRAEIFRMPAVEIGEVILWYHDGNETDEPCPAIVTHVGEYTIAAAVIVKDNYDVKPVDGVRHLSDPGLKLQEVRSRGAWGYGVDRKRTEALAEELKAAISKLWGQVGALKKKAE